MRITLFVSLTSLQLQASEEERKDLERVRDHISAISLKPAGLSQLEEDQVTVDEYVRNLDALPSTISMANLWTQVMHGLESTEESAAFFIDYCRRVGGFPVIRADDETGGNYLRIVEGKTPECRTLDMADLVFRNFTNCQGHRCSRRPFEYTPFFSCFLNRAGSPRCRGNDSGWQENPWAKMHPGDPQCDVSNDRDLTAFT